MKTFLYRAPRYTLAACAVAMSLQAAAQTGSSLIVHPADQAQRDATRAQILQAELASEVAALAQAEQRQVERSQANDSVGATEAQQALAEHTANVAALRREIELVVAPALASPATPTDPARNSALPGNAPLKAASPARLGKVQKRASSTAVAGRVWDTYRPQRAKEPASAATTPAAASTAPVWDLYARTRLQFSKLGAQQEAVRIEAGRSDPPALPYLIYRNPNANR
jgi:hypothetical protein